LEGIISNMSKRKREWVLGEYEHECRLVAPFFSYRELAIMCKVNKKWRKHCIEPHYWSNCGLKMNMYAEDSGLSDMRIWQVGCIGAMRFSLSPNRHCKAWLDKLPMCNNLWSVAISFAPHGTEEIQMFQALLRALPVNHAIALNIGDDFFTPLHYTSTLSVIEKYPCIRGLEITRTYSSIMSTLPHNPNIKSIKIPSCVQIRTSFPGLEFVHVHNWPDCTLPSFKHNTSIQTVILDRCDVLLDLSVEVLRSVSHLRCSFQDTYTLNKCLDLLYCEKGLLRNLHTLEVVVVTKSTQPLLSCFTSPSPNWHVTIITFPSTKAAELDITFDSNTIKHVTFLQPNANPIHRWNTSTVCDRSDVKVLSSKRLFRRHMQRHTLSNH
jgi:hypothetical protein